MMALPAGLAVYCTPAALAEFGVRTPPPSPPPTVGAFMFCRPCQTQWRTLPDCSWCGRPGMTYAQLTDDERTALAMYSPSTWTSGEVPPTMEGI